MSILKEQRSQVFSRRPALGKVYNDFGNYSLFDYANSWKTALSTEGSLLVKMIKKNISKFYGKELAEDVLTQLSRHPLISTIDHHGLLNHPFFINSNLLFSLNDHLKYLICLSTSSVSMNNSSWPGCLVYHNEEKKLLKISLLESVRNMDTVFAHKAIRRPDLDSALHKIIKSPLSVYKKNILEHLLTEEIPESVLKMPNFSDQSSIISFNLWQKFFPQAPKVLYIPIEDVIGEIISEFLKDKDSLFYFLIVNPAGGELLNKYFFQSNKTSDHKGTYLFWGVDSKGGRVHLKRENNILVGESFSMGLEPEIIKTNLEQRKIYPSTLLCFLVILFYKMTCLGGFNQTTLLAEIKRNFIKLLNDKIFDGKYEILKDEISLIPTDNFAESPLVFLKTDKTIKATGIDILFEQDQGLYDKYRDLAKSVSLAESIDSEIPEIYPIVLPTSERIV